ncbi:MAG TPA: hypothetical protein VIH93_07225 [Thermoanaerobaculia bacterium]
MRPPALAALVIASALGVLAMPAAAAGFDCKPCAGVVLDGPAGVAEALSLQSGLKAGSPLFTAWEVPLAPEPPPAETGDAAARIAQAGGTPWLALVFRTPPPLAANAARLQGELEIAAAVGRAAPAGTVFQVVWRPEGNEASEQSLAEYGFLMKRAAVALTGARGNGKVATEALPATAAAVAGLFAQEVGAYVDVLALALPDPPTPEGIAAALAAAAKAGPGEPVALEGVPLPAEPAQVLAEAARWAVAGVDLTLFRPPEPSAAAPPTAAALAPFALLAREFAGDVSYDADSTPTGGAAAWTFVRGKDQALRVIAVAPPGAENGVLALHFADGSLRRPVRFPLGRGRVEPPSGQATASGLDLSIAAPGRVAVLGLERPTAAERGQGVAEKLTVSSTREIPVEEILRRLQAFEDAQDRRLDHYRAVNTTHLRFQVSGVSQAFDVGLEGPFFYLRGEGTDWAWRTFYINGVRWKGKSIPEIPLVQPEKAAALPLQIHFSKEYRYRLRGSETIDGRDAWVVDFAPAAADLASRERLYQGTVWIDRKVYARLRSRAVQLGLSGEILSNEETWTYSPVDEAGKPAPWPASAESAAYVLPLHLVGQQILSVVGSTTVVERETVLTQVEVNGAGFAEARRAVDASDVTMVRDTAKGLRYLVKDKAGERVVKEDFATSKLFAVAGLFYERSLDYPLPLAGANYLTLDFKGSGQQLNVFFAGALATATVAQPRLLGSKLDASGNLFALAIPLTDAVFRRDKEIKQQDVKVLPASVGFHIGRPLGSFWKVDLSYGLLYNRFNRTQDTAGDFVLPSDNFLHSFELGTQFARAGYRLNVNGSYNLRSRWEAWGEPNNPDFNPDDKSFYRWDASLAKSWYLPRFQRIGAELDYVSGSRLDRFSKYQFGFFGNTRVHGYENGKVRATTAYSGHLTYGFEVGELLRIDAVADAAIGTDRLTRLDSQLLAGTGIVGTFIGPWSTLVNLDLGVPVAGPDHGFVMYLAFLKLFK